MPKKGITLFSVDFCKVIKSYAFLISLSFQLKATSILNSFGELDAAGERTSRASPQTSEQSSEKLCGDGLLPGALPMRPGAARSTSSWPGKRWCLEKQNTYTAVLAARIPGARHMARSFGKLGLDGESVGGPDHFLPWTIMLDPPGQRLKLPDGPSVQLRRASERCLGSREIFEGISKIVNANASRFFRGC